MELKTVSDIVLEGPKRNGYIRQAELLEIIPFSAATLWRKVKAREFPQPVKLSKKVTAWHLEDIRTWLQELHNSTLASS